MNKYILVVVLLFVTSTIFSQNPIFFEQKGDTISFYLSCNGSLTVKVNAKYKRVGIFDDERLAFKGNVIDYYYPKGLIAFKAKYLNNLYDGPVITYSKTGTIKEVGVYHNNVRDSIWTSYYNNGKIEKKIDYSNAQKRFIEYYQKNGKPVFLDGNGKYKGYSNKDFNSCEQYQIKGELRDGIMVGRWTIDLGYGTSTEVFENGNFIRGQETPHNLSYEDASLITPSGFPYFENINLLDYLIACNKPGFYLPSYNNEYIENGFLVELEHLISDKINTKDFFYALLEFQIDNGVLNSNSFKSITNDKKKAGELKNVIISLNKWDTPNENLSFTIFLPIFWVNGSIYLKPRDIQKFN